MIGGKCGLGRPSLILLEYIFDILDYTCAFYPVLGVLVVLL